MPHHPHDSTATGENAKTKSMERGKACYNCRRRKMRCDGLQPVCGPCERADRHDDCEYTYHGGRARAEILQESINRLESRIQELEHPHLVLPHMTVKLQQPYTKATGVSFGISATAIYLHTFDLTVDSSPLQEPPFDVIAKLVDCFLSYASEVGFFLNATRFKDSAILNHPLNSSSRPCPALLFCVYLWGVRFSKNPQLMARESQLLSSALELTSTALSGLHPQRVMHTLQAEVLLAHYFFASGRFLEGKYHTASAISLALSSGLHLIRSKKAHNAYGRLSAPRDIIEEGEQIHACWAVMILDKTWAVALSEDAHHDLQNSSCCIDSPWPLEWDEYEQGRMETNSRYENTVDKFLDGSPTSDSGTSTVALLSKAALLLQRSNKLARQVRPDMSPTEIATFQSIFSAHDALIDSFHSTLISPHSVHNPTPAKLRALLLVHSFIHAATLQLHAIPPLQHNGASRAKRRAASQGILGVVLAFPAQLTDYVNPVIGTMWTGAFQEFIEGPYDLGDSTTHVRTLLGRALDAIRPFKATCPLLSYQIAAIEDACGTL
ncbi:Zn(2)-C6 fungal-type domain-containing protein [Mycena indigotica]|uniref:Zn(2)-C6 fungal-type domain-containing protein n=1 Tax=Mycena indigotica TaxID=2126181 RepID=A0A8H6VUM1_9AGAR|nr:Zn(2)-C6 fungal-type domain-containing protein [Mycena indigotica]KAF7294542.1 Zn(2)-C6 fungal-type domain-containing protein [Mycena indigotica]